jgi:hypothetical protein
MENRVEIKDGHVFVNGTELAWSMIYSFIPR